MDYTPFVSNTLPEGGKEVPYDPHTQHCVPQERQPLVAYSLPQLNLAHSLLISCLNDVKKWRVTSTSSTASPRNSSRW